MSEVPLQEAATEEGGDVIARAKALKGVAAKEHNKTSSSVSDFVYDPRPVRVFVNTGVPRP